MKKYIALCLLLGIFTATAGEVYTWTNEVGGTIKAEFVKEKNGIIYLKTADGSIKTIPKRKLMPTDQKRATELANPFKKKTTKSVAKAPDVICELFGSELRNVKKKKVSVDTLNGKIIGIYFSAHWCPPCRKFTPKLVDFYNQMKEKGKPFEIVFASCDNNKSDMYNYMKEMKMPWLSIPFKGKIYKKLSKKYSVTGIPALIIIDQKGNIITKNGTGEVGGRGQKAYDQWVK